MTTSWGQTWGGRHGRNRMHERSFRHTHRRFGCFWANFGPSRRQRRSFSDFALGSGQKRAGQDASGVQGCDNAPLKASCDTATPEGAAALTAVALYQATIVPSAIIASVAGTTSGSKGCRAAAFSLISTPSPGFSGIGQ